MKEKEFFELRARIIDYIKTNRISTTEIADCMNKTGALKNIKTVNRGHFSVGPIKWVYAHDSSNWGVHEQVRETNPGDLVFIEAFNCEDRAIIGELVSKYILVYRQAVGIICNSNFRDANDIIKQNYPIWCTGFNPEGCFNKKPEKDLKPEIKQMHKEKYDGAVGVADDTGVVIITKEFITEEFYEKLKKIEEQEDMWFYCLDHKKWDTYDIVCLKKYL